MKINLFYRMNRSAVARHADYIRRALQSFGGRGIEARAVDLDDRQALAQAIVGGAASDIALFFVTQEPQLLQMIRGRKILWCAFESTHIPARLRALIDAFDEVWTPSKWGREVMQSGGIAPAKLKVVSEGVDSATYFPQPRAHGGFVFLSVAKYEKRKALDEIIQAFGEEFPAATDPGVFLWLKPDFPLFPERIAGLKERLAADKRIKILEGYASDAEMAALYNCADAFLFPSRAEGFGLPCLEAMACGVPALATCYSGQSEYLGDVEGLYLPVDYTLGEIEDEDFTHFFGALYGDEPYGKWANPDVGSLRRAMRAVYEGRDEWKRKAAGAGEIVRRQYDWRAVAERVLEALGA